MSLTLNTEMVTAAQRGFLQELGYVGNVNLTKLQASKLIEELIEQQRQEDNYGDKYGSYFKGDEI